ncbi:MAG: hypothetical protein AABY18_01570 [Candidatus Thermoplasmatota archaeon]
MVLRPLLAVLVLLLTGCAGPLDDGGEPAADEDAVVVPDPTLPGNRTFQRYEYDFGVMVVDDPTLVPYRYSVPLHGSLHLPDGAGAAPLVVLLHGRHGTCAVLGAEIIGPGTCPNAMVVTPVNSYTGYDYIAENLASHGYAVASVDANTINDRDLVGDAGANARGQLLLRTLDEFTRVNATGASSSDVPGVPTLLPRSEVPQAQDRIDVSRVGLMGHSRGGEGVARAVSLDIDSASGMHGLDAIFALAPTDFARWPVAGVPFATLLPYCDGDVYNLQGAWMYDDARRLEPVAPRHQVLAMGANHNFYNTVWTGDDWGTTEAWCGSEVNDSGRDTPEQQRAHGLGLMASFFRLYVGGEQEFAPLWDGTVAWPDTMCPEFDSCDGRLYASHMPVSHLDLAANGVPPVQERLKPAACEPADCPAQPTYGTAAQASWDCHGSGTATFATPDGIEGWTALSVRVGNQQPGNPLHVTPALVGSSAVLPALTSHAAPGDIPFPPRPGDPDSEPGAKTVLSEVRFSFPADADLAAVTAIEIRCDGDGGIQVADIMLV